MKRLVVAFVMMFACGLVVSAECPTPVVSIRGPCPNPCPTVNVPPCPTCPACILNSTPAEVKVVEKIIEVPVTVEKVIEVPVIEYIEEYPTGKWIGTAGVAKLDSWIYSVGSGYRWPSGFTITGNVLYSDDDAGEPNSIRVGCKKYACPSCPDAKDWGVGVNVEWEW